LTYWKSIASDPDAVYDDTVDFPVDNLAPMVSWGINPGQAVGVNEDMPQIRSLPDERKEAAQKAYAHMKFEEGSPIKGKRIDVAFLGSCTNGRLSDLRTAARVLKGKKVASHVAGLVVPGSAQVKREAEKEGLDRIFTEAGFSWRNPGCSMCLAMNPDRLSEDQISAGSSNRNFIGRQGSPRGRTLLMSPAMVAAAAVRGEVTDVREMM
jgi:3-isopropylmalate/(R)-2-methylmalate dehydratase large subunit